jgi:hypothetical protein
MGGQLDLMGMYGVLRKALEIRVDEHERKHIKRGIKKKE